MEQIDIKARRSVVELVAETEPTLPGQALIEHHLRAAVEQKAEPRQPVDTIVEQAVTEPLPAVPALVRAEAAVPAVFELDEALPFSKAAPMRPEPVLITEPKAALQPEVKAPRPTRHPEAQATPLLVAESVVAEVAEVSELVVMPVVDPARQQVATREVASTEPPADFAEIIDLAEAPEVTDTDAIVVTLDSLEAPAVTAEPIPLEVRAEALLAPIIEDQPDLQLAFAEFTPEQTEAVNHLVEEITAIIEEWPSLAELAPADQEAVIVRLEVLAVELLEACGLETDEETVKRFVAALLRPLEVASQPEDEGLSIALRNRLGTREYKPHFQIGSFALGICAV